MHKFSVSAEDFYRTFSEIVPRVDVCMNELIVRYDIVGKSVLSVGAGVGLEEKQFVLAGNDVLLVDIDENGSLLPTIQRIPEKPGLSYWIGDAAEFVPSLDTYDVLYFSSFTPDEMRRSSLVRDHAAEGRPWALSDDPFHPVVMEYATALNAGGLLLIQSYYGGIDTDANPDYLAACERQLAGLDIHLMEVHRFQETHGVMLYAAVKDKQVAAPAAKLSQFHGRAAPEATERIFPPSAASIVVSSETSGREIPEEVGPK